MPLQGFWHRVQGYCQRKSAHYVYRRPVRINPPQPLISFTFDDFPRSALLAGGAILNRFGLAGTYYVSLGLSGQHAPTGELFVAEDLTRLLEHNHELGCHTFSHCDAWETDSERFEASIIENGVALAKLIPGAKFKSFSYPISYPRPLTKAKAARHFLSCRGGGQTLNAGVADANCLSAYFLEKAPNIDAVKQLIEHNNRACGWIIFATHDVADDHTPYGCTPEFFEEVVAYSVRSGARILPVVEALDAIGSPMIPAIGEAESTSGRRF